MKHSTCSTEIHWLTQLANAPFHPEAHTLIATTHPTTSVVWHCIKSRTTRTVLPTLNLDAKLVAFSNAVPVLNMRVYQAMTSAWMTKRQMEWLGTKQGLSRSCAFAVVDLASTQPIISPSSRRTEKIAKQTKNVPEHRFASTESAVLQASNAMLAIVKSTAMLAIRAPLVFSSALMGSAFTMLKIRLQTDTRVSTTSIASPMIAPHLPEIREPTCSLGTAVLRLMAFAVRSIHNRLTNSGIRSSVTMLLTLDTIAGATRWVERCSNVPIRFAQNAAQPLKSAKLDLRLDSRAPTDASAILEFAILPLISAPTIPVRLVAKTETPVLLPTSAVPTSADRALTRSDRVATANKPQCPRALTTACVRAAFATMVNAPTTQLHLQVPPVRCVLRVTSAIPTSADFAVKTMAFRDVLRFNHPDQLATTIACVPTIANSTMESVCTKPEHRPVPFAQLILSVRARVVTDFPILRAGVRAPNQEIFAKLATRMPIAEEACFATLQVGHHPDLAFRLQMDPVVLLAFRTATALPASVRRGLVPTKMPTALRAVLELLAAVDLMESIASDTPETKEMVVRKDLASEVLVSKTQFAVAIAMLEHAQLDMHVPLSPGNQTPAFTMEVRRVETLARPTNIVLPEHVWTGLVLSSADTANPWGENLADTISELVLVVTRTALVPQVPVPFSSKRIAIQVLHIVWQLPKLTNRERRPLVSAPPRKLPSPFVGAPNPFRLQSICARTDVSCLPKSMVEALRESIAMQTGPSHRKWFRWPTTPPSKPLSMRMPPRVCHTNEASTSSSLHRHHLRIRIRTTTHPRAHRLHHPRFYSRSRHHLRLRLLHLRHRLPQPRQRAVK